MPRVNLNDPEIACGLIDSLRTATMHWFFLQGIEALRAQLFVPGVLSLLTGIEATLHITLHELEGKQFTEPLSDHRVLSNTLVSQCHELGLPVELLAFPGEADFLRKLGSKKPNRIDVKLVALRNALAHGNVLEFVNKELGEENQFFTPECLRDVADELLEIAVKWSRELGEFRSKRLGL